MPRRNAIEPGRRVFPSKVIRRLRRFLRRQTVHVMIEDIWGSLDLTNYRVIES
jgi:hypothetical protein